MTKHLLLSPSNDFFRAVTVYGFCYSYCLRFPGLSLLLSGSFFQNSNFFIAKLIPNSYWLRIDSSLGCLRFRRTSLFRIKISTFSKQVLFLHSFFFKNFQKSRFFNKVNSLKKLLFKNNWKEILRLFGKKNVFKKALLCSFLFQKRYFYNTATLSFNNHISHL